MGAIKKKENKPFVGIIDNLEDLNELGCSFFLDANSFHKTIVTSTELRWLTIKLKEERFLAKQQEANNYINNIANNYEPETPKLNIRILLNKNPKKIKSNKHIVQLIKAGVDVRYKKTKNTIRICNRENRLFVSYAPDTTKTVNAGIEYISKKSNDPIINHYTNLFETDFKDAKKVTVKNEKLIFSDNLYMHCFKAMQDITIKDIILMIVGAVLGGLITIFLK